MRLDAAVRVLFAFYCVEAGILLTLVPWSPAWDRACIQIPVVFVRQALLGSWGRGAVTGFGLVHLVWSAHEMTEWVRSRARGPGGVS